MLLLLLTACTHSKEDISAMNNAEKKAVWGTPPQGSEQTPPDSFCTTGEYKHYIHNFSLNCPIGWQISESTRRVNFFPEDGRIPGIGISGFDLQVYEMSFEDYLDSEVMIDTENEIFSTRGKVKYNNYKETTIDGNKAIQGKQISGWMGGQQVQFTILVDTGDRIIELRTDEKNREMLLKYAQSLNTNR